MPERQSTPCPVIEGLMGVRLMAEDAEHPAIDAAIREIAALRAELRRAHHWDEYHPAFIAGSKAAAASIADDMRAAEDRSDAG